MFFSQNYDNAHGTGSYFLSITVVNMVPFLISDFI